MTKKDNPTIEEKIAMLEQKVAWFDGDEFVLEQAMDRYDEAQKLADEIQVELADLKNTIERVNLTEG
ncbi:MAG: hypothetical protein UY35_C0033G0008 [Candidatus Saccharibacteria bacterium GW2011_GWC2_48_9]|nr:MAG: hypothetical protein UY35_C0033G0008 [Candidatus Saccharibacteria bacterium GW2011_GWC2_48_9]HCH33908.1 hypothetical protein [Candidatus Saccharibacteria bacterium]